MRFLKKYLCKYRIFVVLFCVVMGGVCAGKVTVHAAESMNGLIMENGYFQLYTDGEKRTDYSGLFQYDSAWFMLTDGVVNTSLRGMVEYDNALFYVADGQVVTDYSGLVMDGDEWYYIGSGQVQQVSELVLYDKEWFVVRDGKLDTAYNGIYDYNGGSFFVAAGMLNSSITGLQCCGADWFYFANGQVADYVGLVEFDGVWFYVDAGKLASNYSGVVEYNGAYFGVANGQVVAEEKVTDYGNDLVGSALNQIIKPGMSEIEKVKAIHDYMLINIDYDYISYGEFPETTWTVDGVLSTHYAICEGYARVFKAMCDRVGIECEFVTGYATGPHAWNQVKVDDQWYNIDVTWDDPVHMDRENSLDDHSSNAYTYFLLSDEDMDKDHTPYSETHECTAPSIMERAYVYGCPWETPALEYYYVENDEDVAKAVKKAMANGGTNLGLLFSQKTFSLDKCEEAAINVLIPLGYDYFDIQKQRHGMYYLDNYAIIRYYMEGVEKKDLITSEQALKDYLLEWAENPADTSFMVTCTVDDLDCDAISRWAYVNGMDMYAYYGYEYIPGYHQLCINIRNYGYEVFTETEEIFAALNTAYTSGLAEYTFLYDYSDTGMSDWDAWDAVVDNHNSGYVSVSGSLNSGMTLFTFSMYSEECR